MSVERAAKTVNGWAMLIVDIVLYAAATALIAYSFIEGSVDAGGETVPIWWMLITGCVVLAAAIVVSPGFFTLQPNEARVLILFGDYKGTSRETGFRWGNPFFANGSATSASSALAKAAEQIAAAAKKDKSQNKPRTLGRYKVSLRARTLNGETPQGERQARQPDRDRRRRRLARRGHRPGRLRRRRLRAVRARCRASPRCATSPAATPTTTRDEEDDEITLRSNVDEVSQALQARAAGAPGQGRRRGRRGAAHAPRLRAGDRPGDAPPPAGRGGHRRAPQDRRTAP